MENSRPVTNREIQAMIFNLKEQRVLAKTMQTLDLEENYAMKLIGLGNRQLRIGHKRMKNKVSKIQSHLSAEEIADLRLAEMEGRFIPICNTTHSGSSKISAASKRLKLETNRIPRSKSTTNTSDSDLVSSNQGSLNSDLSPDSNGSQTARPSRNVQKSVALTSTSMSSFGNSLGSAPSSSDTQLRPFTSSGAGSRHSGLTRSSSIALRPRTAPGFGGYSSHDATTRKAAQHNSVLNLIATQHAITTNTHRSPTERRCSLISTSSIGSNVAKEKAAERRQDLLEEEQCTKVEIENKRMEFMERITAWVKENPAVTIKPKPKEPQEKKKRLGGPVRFRPRHQVLSEAERQQQTDQAWKDLTKCRYLRISEDDMDITGVNTLVKDHMAMFDLFKNNNVRRKPTVPTHTHNELVELESVIELNT